MGQRSKRSARCGRCRLAVGSCVCEGLVPIELDTRLVLVLHARERTRTTTTGPLALAALSNSELFVHGEPETRLDLNSLFSQARRVLLLFPSEGAEPLTREFVERDSRPITLVVPEGSWRQASRAARRIPGLERAERVRLTSGATSEWGIRREPKPEGLATFEAIARALGVIESVTVQAHLEALFRQMIVRASTARGSPPPSPRAAASRGETHPAAPIGEPRTAVAPPQLLPVLFEDPHLVVVNKPSGMLVHRGWGRDERPALQILRDQLGQWLYPVHRLDRATSGVLLFAKSPDVAREFCALFEASRVEKRYWALCRGHDPSLVQVDHPLAQREGAEARPAVTDFRLLGTSGRYGLYEACPRTGRTHQIRRHLKHASHPIIGDVRYGKGEHNRLFRERYGLLRLALHCHRLGLQHPRTGRPLIVDAPLPADLKAVLEALGLSEPPPADPLRVGC